MHDTCCARRHVAVRSLSSTPLLPFHFMSRRVWKWPALGTVTRLKRLSCLFGLPLSYPGSPSCLSWMRCRTRICATRNTWVTSRGENTCKLRGRGRKSWAGPGAHVERQGSRDRKPRPTGVPLALTDNKSTICDGALQRHCCAVALLWPLLCCSLLKQEQAADRAMSKRCHRRVAFVIQ